MSERRVPRYPACHLAMVSTDNAAMVGGLRAFCQCGWEGPRDEWEAHRAASYPPHRPNYGPVFAEGEAAERLVNPFTRGLFDAARQDSRRIFAQVFDPGGRGLHPIGGIGVPHDGCECRNCRQARCPCGCGFPKATIEKLLDAAVRRDKPAHISRDGGKTWTARYHTIIIRRNFRELLAQHCLDRAYERLCKEQP